MDDSIGNTQKRIWAGIHNAYRSAALHGCVYPECSTGESIVRAHSIQRARVLESVADGGHVYTFKSHPEGMVLSRIGIGKATTFTGFCKHHDNDLFSSVDYDDTNSFDSIDSAQVLALSLRSVAYEYWKKRNAQRIHGKMLEFARQGNVEEVARWLNIEHKDALYFVRNANHTTLPSLQGTEDAIPRMQRFVHSLIYQLESRKHHLSKIVTFVVESSPVVAASAQFPLDYDLEGNELTKRRRDPDLAEVALNVIPECNRTHFAFLWHRRFNGKFEPFFRAMGQLDAVERRIRLSQMLVMHCENVAISPAVVEAWTEQQKATIEKLFAETLYHAKPYRAVPAIDFFSDWKCYQRIEPR